MKKIILGFFVTLGIIFFVLLLALGYVYATNMFGIRTILSGDTSMNASEQSASLEDKNPILSPAQEKVLEGMGIDPSLLPKTITPQMMSCFNEKLGAQRVLEIKNGSTPKPAEYLVIKSCF